VNVTIKRRLEGNSSGQAVRAAEGIKTWGQSGLNATTMQSLEGFTRLIKISQMVG
jgi:hypothetical protein